LTPEGSGNPPLGPLFFLSDYGLADEFVGVVHAVVARLAPGVPVVDLTHQIPPFDVSAGAAALARSAPSLGPGVVLAVVDPGVGTVRRPIALEAAGSGPRFWVGPDNGLLVAGAEAGGPVVGAWELRAPPPRGTGTTFDGRDLFAPAAAALVAGAPPGTVGRPVAVDGVVRLPRPLLELTGGVGDWTLRVEVTWVDRFGNVQLAAGPDELAGLRPDRAAEMVVSTESAPGSTWPVRPVRAFAELDPGELGLLADANGRLALVESEAPAARRIGVGPGSVVRLGPAPPVGPPSR